MWSFEPLRFILSPYQGEIGGPATERTLRHTKYELTPSKDLLDQKGRDLHRAVRRIQGDPNLRESEEPAVIERTKAEIDRSYFEGLVVGVVHRAFGDPQHSRRPSWMDCSDKPWREPGMKRMEKDRWICNKSRTFVRRDSAVGLLLLHYDTHTKTLPLSPAQGEAGAMEQADPSGAVELSLDWMQMGLVPCLLGAGSARYHAGWWQTKMEDALREAGFGIRRIEDVLE